MPTPLILLFYYTASKVKSQGEKHRAALDFHSKVWYTISVHEILKLVIFLLEIKELSWSAPDGRKIIKDLSLTIPNNKLTVITGPNGSGKTTLAKLIAGVETAESGSIFLDGEDITPLDITQRAKKGIGFAFQQPVRFKGITVKDLLVLAAGGIASEDKLNDVLLKVGLQPEKYLDRDVDAHLSGGEIKRVEIATVLLRSSKLMVFDEPEAGIDIWSFNNLIDTFSQLKSSTDSSIIIISHQERILSIADEIILLRDGDICEQGKRDSMFPRLFCAGGEDCQCPNCIKGGASE